MCLTFAPEGDIIFFYPGHQTNVPSALEEDTFSIFQGSVGPSQKDRPECCQVLC